MPDIFEDPKPRRRQVTIRIELAIVLRFSKAHNANGNIIRYYTVKIEIEVVVTRMTSRNQPITIRYRSSRVKMHIYALRACM